MLFINILFSPAAHFHLPVAAHKAGPNACMGQYTPALNGIMFLLIFKQCVKENVHSSLWEIAF